ncbi:MAG: hypothetical protein LBV73_01670 [Paraburkholderia sp.]|jgi:hypothetical protein|nr:hypothetical protein [Paraburkholderia sp.]
MLTLFMGNLRWPLRGLVGISCNGSTGAYAAPLIKTRPGLVWMQEFIGHDSVMRLARFAVGA